ncbi:hypothetical protein CMO93_02160 [Candidatus Woesearchaeota archaeon]|nr:hypothetical protein [Candidatus Woesearchaeota archaeon]|tara:strand:- start:2427 stop:3254 length:828 start_codon:yes stop_codon:yes gene_type:complete
MLGKQFSFNGKLLPAEKAAIPIDNIEFTYGFGVYENLKIRKRLLYFPEMHCERILNSAKIINLKPKFNKIQIKNYLVEFVNKIKEDSFNVKILMVGNKTDSDLYIFAAAPKYMPRKAYTQGVKVITYQGDRQFPNAKTLSMLMSYVAYKKARENNAYDSLMINNDNKIREGTRTNFFYTDGKTIFTAPKEQVLNGVTRITLLEALKKENIAVREKELDLKELKKYKGFFLTSTSSKVVPISEINNKKIEIPEIIKKVIRVYNRYLEEYGKKSKII